METEDIRTKTWNLWVECDFSERYWNLLKKKAGKLDLTIRGILSFASLASIIALAASDGKLVVVCSWVSGIAAIFACTIAPLIRFDTRFGRIRDMHCSWRNVERQAWRLWEDIHGDMSAETAKRKHAEIAAAYDALVTEDIGIGENDPLALKAEEKQKAFLDEME